MPCGTTLSLTAWLWDRNHASRGSPLDDYSLLLEYKTGERKRFDVRPYISGTFMGKLADVDYFKTARLEYDGWFVGWPGGQDLGPDDLYEFSTPVG